MGSLDNFKKRIKELEDSLRGIESSGDVKFAAKNEFFDYGAGKAAYLRTNVDSSLLRLKESAWILFELGQTKENRQKLLELFGKAEKLKKGMQVGEIEKSLQEIKKIVDSLKTEKTIEDDISFINAPKMPEEIAEEIAADLNEIRKCFITGAFRSCVVLCGRVLETALYRKYYDVSGQDLMESAPGIGLGKLIAKLKEKDVKVDPGLTQQIHLINQVRVFSVHSKKEAFYPSKEQAQAVILFTLDVLRKLFE